MASRKTITRIVLETIKLRTAIMKRQIYREFHPAAFQI